MPFPLGALFPALRPHLAGCVNAPAWEKIESLAGGLPPLGSRGFFEVHLGARSRVDFGFYAHGREGREALADFFATGHDLPAGEAVRPLLADWLGPETPVARASTVVWMEYDLPAEQDGLRPPLVHCDVMSSSGEEIRCIARRSRLLLSSREPGDAQLAVLDHCIRSLPAYGRVTFLTDLRPARATDDLRIVAELPGPETGRWLQDAGWPGDLRRWNEVLTLLGADDLHLPVYLDLGEEIRAGLGVEFTAPGRQGARETWQVFLQRLVDTGLATADETTAVLGWRGTTTVDVPEIEPLLRLQRALGIKIVLSAAGEMTAKAYLAFDVRPTLF